MAAALVLIAVWILAFLVVGRLDGALVLVVLATGAIFSMGARLNPQAGILALAAVLTGIFLSHFEWTFQLTLALAALLAALMLVSLWPHRHHPA